MLLREFKLDTLVGSAVQFHDKLNPKLWQGRELDPKVRYKLLRIAKHFVEFINLPNLRLKDITLSGSNAAYTYTENSNLDLHLVVDIPSAADYYLRPLYDAKKNQYNFNHDVKIHNIDVEVYVQASSDTHHSAGIYSVLDNQWLSTPQAQKVNINDEDVALKVKNYLSKIKFALRVRDLETANKIKDELNKLRKTGLDRGGEFSVENIAFKVLRAKGYIDQLRQHIYDLEDEALSLENMYETQRNYSTRT